MKITKWVSISLALTLAMGTAAGCASGDKGGQTSSSGKEEGSDSQPTTIKALTILAAGEPPILENNKTLEEIEKRANIKLNLEVVPGDVYTDKVNIAIAAGNQYDLILLTDGKDDKYVKLAKQGAFHDLTELVAKNDNLQKIPEYTWNNTTVDGKTFGIPRPRGIYGGGNSNIFIRKDWLDKYNLPVPATLDEFTHALQVFKEKDPAGGGNTIPMVAGPFNSPWFGSLNPIGFSFGLPYSYKVEDGQAVAYFQTPEYKDYLDWIRMAYTSGLIDKDAPVTKTVQSKDKFKSGMAGAMVDNVGMLDDSNMSVMKKADPNAELVGIPFIEGPNGDKGVQMIEGYFGIWVIPSKVPKEKAEKIVEFLNWSASEEATIISKAGIEGIHYDKYNLETGEIERNDEQKKLFDKEKPAILILQNEYDKYYYASSLIPEIRKEQRAVLDEFEKAGVENPFISILSETLGKNPEHTKKLIEASTNYVMGKGEWEAVQAEIDAWSNGIGAQILKEYMDGYNASKK
ncbi:extracellular solute-binding protein [Paenibacillus sp. J2TS4]|uniref:extracellular solute-binding protein n=1 Tax=Paenibacillus sp. J2TS4 TaxID=2807194 RepID=UPI001B00C9AA|nr:extracellular solute-binding protein [Paenibacillus sp. J2TS4]GIP35014.1 putative ABC transporter peptide-binding protein YtcQ [Paenibacillus sp. J2TS4]